MKRISAFLLTGILASAASSFSIAEDTGLFDRLDVNKDGFVTSDEIDDEKQRLFDRLLRTSDKNKDGRLTREELSDGTTPEPESTEPARPAGPGNADRLRDGDAATIFARLDKDGNGKLSRDEAPERLRAGFGKVDADASGDVDLAEFRRAAAQRTPGQPTDSPRPDSPRPQNAPDSRSSLGAGFRLLRAIDRDGDGQLSAEEIAGASAALSKLDTNKDGTLSRDELTAGGPTSGQPSRDTRPENRNAAPREQIQRLMKRDTNGDGLLSRDEAPEFPREKFDAVDSNRDGQLSPSEIGKAVARQRRPE